MNIKIFDITKKHKKVLENFSYITLLQFFLMLSPLITYPYLVRVLGMDLYGILISAQVLASYGTILVNFGTDGVCAKHVSVYRDDKEKLSEIVCNILGARTVLWLLGLFLYMSVVFIIPGYRTYWLLFLLTYGATVDVWLFPQYFFQGIENMKTSTLITLGIKLFFILLVFFLVKGPEDYLFVPYLYFIGYLFGGLISLYLIFIKMKIHFCRPKKKHMFYYLKESSPIFASDMICTIKDKLNYFIISSSSLSDVVIYDLGVKLTALCARPVSIVSTVLFPKFARNHNVNQIKKVLFSLCLFVILLVVSINIFLPFIVDFFLNRQIDLVPLRIFTLAPIFLTVSSYLYTNVFLAYGYNAYALKSILVTTMGYLMLLFVIFITKNTQHLISYTILAVASYFIEFVYRIYLSRRIVKKESQEGV